MTGAAVLIGVAREGLPDVTFEKKDLSLEMKGASHGNAGRGSPASWGKSPCKGPEAGRGLQVCGIVRGGEAAAKGSRGRGWQVR